MPSDATSVKVVPKTLVFLRAWPALLAAAFSMLWINIAPLLSPLLIALALGVIVTNTRLGDIKAVRMSPPGAKTLLRLGIVLLGTRLTWDALSSLGVSGLLIALSTVVLVFLLTCWMGNVLRLERGIVTLVATAFSVCGAAAIAAVESSIRRRDRDVAIALAMVTIFGTVMIAVIPSVGAAIGLSPLEIGIWAGASIHEVAQVVAAASLAGGTTVVTAATTVKLIRVALLVLVVGAARWRHRDERSGSVDAKVRFSTFLPWFLVGFMGLAALSIFGVVPDIVRPTIDTMSTLLLSAGMFGLGLAVKFSTLFPVPLRVVTLSAFSTLVAAIIPLLFLVAMW